MRLKRQDVPVKQTWDLTDLFATTETWENELASIQEDVEQIVNYKGKLDTDASTLLAALKELEAFQERILRVTTYATLRSSVDGSDPNYQAGSAKSGAAMSQIQAKLSFFESELLTISTDTIDKFLQDEAELESYKKMLSEVMEKKPYRLTPDMEEMLASLSEV